MTGLFTNARAKKKNNVHTPKICTIAVLIHPEIVLSVGLPVNSTGNEAGSASVSMYVQHASLRQYMYVDPLAAERTAIPAICAATVGWVYMESLVYHSV